MPKISLEAVRVNAKMTQKQWAKALGVSNTTIVNWEKGNTEPSISQLREMSKISGVPMDFIFVPDKSNQIEFSKGVIQMNELEIFKNEEFGEIRTVMKDGQPMFCLSDVCKALEISNVGNVKQRLSEKGIHTADTLTNG